MSTEQSHIGSTTIESDVPVLLEHQEFLPSLGKHLSNPNGFVVAQTLKAFTNLVVSGSIHVPARAFVHATRLQSSTHQLSRTCICM